MGNLPDRFSVIQQARWAGRRFFLAHDREEGRPVYLIQGRAGTQSAAYSHHCLPAVEEVPAAEGEWLLATPPEGESLEDLRLAGRLTEEALAGLLLAAVDALAHLGAMVPSMVPAYLDPACIKRGPEGWKVDYLAAVVQAPEARRGDGVMPAAYPVGVLLHWLFTGQVARLGSMSRPQIGRIAPWVSPALKAVMVRCLDRSYASPGDLRRDLERLAQAGGMRGLAARLGRAAPEAGAAGPSGTDAASNAGPARSARSAAVASAVALADRLYPALRRWGPYVAAGLAVALLLGLGVYRGRFAIAAALAPELVEAAQGVCPEPGVPAAEEEGQAGTVGLAGPSAQPQGTGESQGAAGVSGALAQPGVGMQPRSTWQAGPASQPAAQALDQPVQALPAPPPVLPQARPQESVSDGEVRREAGPYDPDLDKARGAMPLQVLVNGEPSGTVYLFPSPTSPQLSLAAVNRLLGRSIQWAPTDGKAIRLYDGEESVLTMDYSLAEGRLWIQLTPLLQETLGLQVSGYRNGQILFTTR